MNYPESPGCKACVEVCTALGVTALVGAVNWTSHVKIVGGMYTDE